MVIYGAIRGHLCLIYFQHKLPYIVGHQQNPVFT